MFASVSALSRASSAAANPALFLSNLGGSVPAEYDDKERQAEMYLFTRPVEGFPDTQDNMLRHWVLAVKFIDDSWRTAEGQGDKDNKLAANYTKHPPREKGNFYELGKVTLSPAQLRRFVLQNECNGQPYLAALQNCQDWVKCLLKLISPPILKKLEKEFPTLKLVHPLLALAAGSFSASSDSMSQLFKSFKS